MTDQVHVDDLPDDTIMRIFERAGILPDGVTVWLRRYTQGSDGARRYLADGRWCAQRGGLPHTFAVPLDATHGGGAV